jgi:hypothetical protein
MPLAARTGPDGRGPLRVGAGRSAWDTAPAERRARWVDRQTITGCTVTDDRRCAPVSISFELPKAPPLTAEEYETLVAPEGMRLELWNGSLDIAAAAQMMWHSEVASRIRKLYVELVVEVISPESDERDRVVKPFEYARAGIPEFWLVETDPQAADGALINMFRLALQSTGMQYALVRRASLAELEKEAGG